MLWIALACAPPCGDETACPLDDGLYNVFAPEGVQGPLPVLYIFHGWNGTPEGYYSNDEMMGAVLDAGFLAVLPEGADGTWTIDDMGLEGNGRDELAFFDAVLDDVERRYQVDTARRYATGFSLGGSFTYTLACERGDLLAAVSPMSGGFWEPLPATCEVPPVPISHTHGLSDTTWPYEGREVTEGDASGTQAPVDDDITFWRTHNGCAAEPSESWEDGEVSCTAWRGCEADSEVQLCTHAGGHSFPDDWEDRMMAWLPSFVR